MIHVIATIQAAPGRRVELIAAFQDLIPLVRAEVGCIEYGTAIDVQTPITVQAPVQDDVLTVMEKWEDVPALHDHLAAPHMLRHRERVAEIVRNVEIRVLQPV